MSSIQDEVRIAATAGKAWEALTTQAGYRGWWNKVAEIGESEAKLLFIKDGQPVNMRFRIDELVPREKVGWTCIAHDMASWVGTTLAWRIRESGGEVLVSLDHAGWKEAAPEPVAQGWKHFLGSLKSYLETGAGQPW
jgi:uncharacterized protein YndB with AHSA1/START domain